MWPVKGITAGGSRITFYGQHLNVFSPLGAYFVPSNDTGLASLYGHAVSRSEGSNFKLEILPCTVCTNITMNRHAVHKIHQPMLPVVTLQLMHYRLFSVLYTLHV